MHVLVFMCMCWCPFHGLQDMEDDMEMDMSGGEEEDMEAPIKVVKNYKRQVRKVETI